MVSEKKDNLNIIKIIVASGSEKPYFLRKYGMTEKGSFIRIGAASEPMPQKMIDTSYSKECFKFTEHFLRMSFPIHKEIEDSLFNDEVKKGGPINRLTYSQVEVLSLLRESNTLSKRELGKLLNINVSAAQAHIDLLKEKGYIKRIGGTRGYWQIIE